MKEKKEETKEKNRKKLKLPKKLRIALMVVASLIFVITASFAFKGYKYPGFINETVPLYSYHSKANINYQVLYNPNILYAETVAGEGLTYITQYIKDVKALLNFQFTGEREAEYKGEYEVSAAIKGTVKEGDKIKTIWTKDYQLLPRTSFQGKDKKINVQTELDIDYKQYYNFVQRFIEDTKINSDVNLVVYWKVWLDAQTDKGPIKEELTPVLSIPLNERYFQMGGSTVKENNSALETVTQKAAPVNTKKVTVLTGLALLALVGAIFLYFFTVGYVEDNYVKQSMKKIMKDHKDRLVSLHESVVLCTDNIIPVKTMEDLVRIADELSKPVLYKYEGQGVPAFYVLDEAKTYLYEVKVPQAESIKESKVQAEVPNVKA